MTSYVLAIVIFALSRTIYEIFANQIKCQKFDLQNEDQRLGENRDLRHTTRNVRFHIGDFSPEFYIATWQYSFTQNGNTHLHTQRETGVLITGKICKAYLTNKIQHL